MDENAPNFELYGVTKDEILVTLAEQGIALSAISDDGSEEIVISKLDIELT